MPRPSRFKSRGLQYLYDRFIGDDPERVASYEKALANARAAQAIYDLRTEAGLTQAELASRVGTTASVISRLEDADYEGHTLSMIARVAAALGRRVEMRFPPVDEVSSCEDGVAAEPKESSPAARRSKRKAKP